MEGVLLRSNSGYMVRADGSWQCLTCSDFRKGEWFVNI